MKLSDKLRAKRAEIAKAMRSMVEKAEAENRELTAEERTAFDKSKGDITALDTRIADVTATEEEERGSNGRTIAGENRGLGEGEARALLPNQRMVDLLPKPESRQLSTVKWLRGVMMGEWDGADPERRATLVEGTGSLGGLLVPPAPISANLIDVMRNASAFVPAGALTIPMDNPEMTLVKVLTTPTPGWRGEGVALPSSDMTFGPIKVKVKTLGVMVETTVELVEDAPTVEQVVNNAIGQALGLELDRVAFFGNGTDEPRGLDNETGINEVSMGTNGATPDDYDEFLDAIYAVEALNGSPGAAVYSPRTANTLRKLKTGLSGDKTTLVPPPEFTALRRIVSNQIGNTYTQGSATNTSKAFVGDFSQAAVAMRTGVQLEATRTGGTDTFSKMKVAIRAYMRADVVFFRPTFFTRIVGIKP